MHAIVLVIVVFLRAVPAIGTTPAAPERSITSSVIAPDADTCIKGGAAVVSRMQQDPKVSYATFNCFDATNMADKSA